MGGGNPAYFNNFNFSEFEITVCGSCKIKNKKNKLAISNFFNLIVLQKNLHHFSDPHT